MVVSSSPNYSKIFKCLLFCLPYSFLLNNKRLLVPCVTAKQKTLAPPCEHSYYNTDISDNLKGHADWRILWAVQTSKIFRSGSSIELSWVRICFRKFASKRSSWFLEV